MRLGDLDVAPIIHGEWIGKPLAGYAAVKCSICGSVFAENKGIWKYCPNCGAKMDLEETSVKYATSKQIDLITEGDKENV